MNVRDWALIIFTIMAQMAVGSFLVLGVMHFFAARKAGPEEADRLSDRALLAIGPVMVLGLVASLFHLGDPFRAYRAVTNLGSSWLSREIFFGVLFAVLGGAFAIAQWRKISTPTTRNVLAWLAALAGVGLIVSMSSVYLLPTQPAWNTFWTPVTFAATTLLLGSLAIGAALVANYAYLKRKEPGCAEVQLGLMRDFLRWIAVASLVLLGIELVAFPIYLATLAGGPAAAVQSMKMMLDPYGWVMVLRLVLAFVGAGVFALFLYQNALNPGREKMLGNLAYVAFAFVLVAEVLGRVLFYATHVGVGL